MKVLIACERSGNIRREFRRLGHEAYSCDLEPSEDDGAHIQDDALNVIHFGWDLMIAHPPCQHLAVSGARWFKTKQVEQRKAIYFFRELVGAPIDRICIENPVCIMSTLWRKPDQIIQPWQFGHGETKKTCLWLKNLTKLTPTNIVEGREPRAWKMAPSPTRSADRARTYQGIAKAMAEQWGRLTFDRQELREKAMLDEAERIEEEREITRELEYGFGDSEDATGDHESDAERNA